jgi:hypothetical protein
MQLATADRLYNGSLGQNPGGGKIMSKRVARLVALMPLILLLVPASAEAG